MLRRTRNFASNRQSRKKKDGGRMMRVSPHPPDFVSFPWYNLIVRISNPPSNITSVTLFQAFVTQTDVGLGAGIDFRLQAFRIWAPLLPMNAGTALQPITVSIMDPIGATAGSNIGGTGQRTLEQITDFPNQVSRACVGYVYPKAQREFAFSTNNSVIVPLINVTAAGSGNGSVAYFNVQWRSANFIAPPNLSDSMEVLSINHPYGCFCSDCRK